MVLTKNDPPLEINCPLWDSTTSSVLAALPTDTSSLLDELPTEMSSLLDELSSKLPGSVQAVLPTETSSLRDELPTEVEQFPPDTVVCKLRKFVQSKHPGGTQTVPLPRARDRVTSGVEVGAATPRKRLLKRRKDSEFIGSTFTQNSFRHPAPQQAGFYIFLWLLIPY